LAGFNGRIDNLEQRRAYAPPMSAAPALRREPKPFASPLHDDGFAAFGRIEYLRQSRPQLRARVPLHMYIVQLARV
jgi:hypothetical protein